MADQIFLTHAELALKMRVKVGWVYRRTRQGAVNPPSALHVMSCALAILRAYDATLYVGVLLNAQAACLIAHASGLRGNRSVPLCREAVNSMEDDAVLLSRKFRKSVRGERILGHGFYFRQRLAVTIYGGGTGKYQPLHLGVPGRYQHVQGGGDIRLMAADGVFHGALDRRNCGLMEHVFNSLHAGLAHGKLRKVTFDQFDAVEAIIEVASESRAEIIHHSY